MEQREKSDATVKGVEGCVEQAVRQKTSYMMWYVFGGASLVMVAYFAKDF